MIKGPTSKMRVRTRIIALFLSLLGLYVFFHLIQLTLIDGDTYQQKALDQQLKDTSISPKRGTIYDANMKVLAKSASVWTVYIIPKQIKDDAQRELLVNGLSELLELDKDKLMEQSKKNTYYAVVKRKIELEDAKKVRQFATDNDLSCIDLAEDSKRYYPFGNFASTVIGFTGTDSQGLAGLEAYYDKYLTGSPGRTVAAKNAWGLDMPFQYEKLYEANNGSDLVLTIDEVLQHYLEKQLDIAVNEHKVQDKAAGIVMNVKTGEILAMATKPDFDLNDPFTITDATALEEMQNLTGDALKEYRANAQNKQWRNKIISDLYEPGSVFKIVTGSSALEEGVTSMDDHFSCSGSVNVAGTTMKCWKTSGHGSETFLEGIKNSCNPVFMELGARLGAERFYKYFKAFGLAEKTGIDISGEALSYYYTAEQMGPVEIASCSFGQSNKITPLQMITAACAAVNGGKLMQPHLVKQIMDSDGNITKTFGAEVKRQVISEETSSAMALALEKVVSEGGGKNAYVSGYRIGGKSGTSQKLDGEEDERIASFLAFAPADDPQIAILVIVDNPKGVSSFGSYVAGPVVGAFMTEALPYLGIEPKYNEKELALVEISTPRVEGQAILEAQGNLSKAELKFQVEGNGSTVVKQVPAAGAMIPKNGRVILYTTEESAASSAVTMPNLSGLTVSQAMARINAAELNVKVTGAGTDNPSNVVANQSIEEGKTVDKGTVVTVEFRSTTDAID